MKNDEARAVDSFLVHQIETIPHLEALLLLWRSRPKNWTVEEMSRALYLNSAATREILNDLVRRTLISSTEEDGEFFRYDCDPQRDKLMQSVEQIYQEDLIRVTKLIHSRPTDAVQAFARAFRLKKDAD